MRKIITVLIAASLACSCDNKKKTPEKYTDLFLYNLKGDIQTIEDSVYKINTSGAVKPDSIAYEKGEYKNGYATKYTDIDSSGKIASESFYSHFDNGAWKEYKQVQNGKTIFSSDYEIDSAGNYVKGRQYDSTGKLQYFYGDLKHNQYRWLTEGKLYKPDSNIAYTFKNNYQDQLYIGGSSFDSSGKETYKSTIKLNDKGDAVEETDVFISTDPATKKDSTTTTVKRFRYDSYDDTGNWTQMTELDKNNKPAKITKRKITYARQ